MAKLFNAGGNSYTGISPSPGARQKVYLRRGLEQSRFLAHVILERVVQVYLAKKRLATGDFTWFQRIAHTAFFDAILPEVIFNQPIPVDSSIPFPGLLGPEAQRISPLNFKN